MSDKNHLNFTPIVKNHWLMALPTGTQGRRGRERKNGGGEAETTKQAFKGGICEGD